ncbi:MAG: 3-deoxy-7-phosphoheptulonate synthase [bacterium]|nr:3-deoxy-7-phosphoheptulonate synthase [bacterium]
MIIIMKPDATEEHLQSLTERLESLGIKVHISKGVDRTVVGAIGDTTILREEPIEVFPGVEMVQPIMQPFKLAGREVHPENTVIEVGPITIGGERIHVMAGPCSVEGREVLLETARECQAAGATILRGGAFKPRTSPYSFQGLGEEGLKFLAEAREATGMLIITECMDARDADLIYRYTDIIQIGARSMHNFTLLKEVGALDKPVMLKRGMSATIKDLLMSAEYILAQGNHRVMLCERGIRTFETATRNTLDLSAVPVIKALSHLPVVVDPSHGVGVWDYVAPMAKGAVAVGADVLMIEVHPRPEEAKSDGPQALVPSRFKDLMNELRAIAQAVGRVM